MKKCCLMIFVAFFVLLQVFSQTLDNNQKAFSIVQKSQVAMGGRLHNSILVTSKGVIHNLGHYDVPEKTIDLPIEETVAFFTDEDATYAYGKMQNRGNTYQRVAVSKNDSLYIIGYYDQDFTKTNASDFAFEAAKALPSQLLHLTFKNRKSLRYLGVQTPFYLLSFNCANQESITLYIHQQSYLLEKVETIGYHNLYGDVTFTTEYQNFVDNGGMKIPQKRIDYEFGKIQREVAYSDIRFDAKPDTTFLKIKWLPKMFKDKLATIAETNEAFTFENISPYVDLIKITSQNNKSLVVQFTDHLALFELPQGMELQEKLMHEIKKRYPTKPLRYLFVTHHHPDHAGGLRAYSYLPVTLVTTQGNKEYFEKLLGTKHSLGLGNVTEHETKLKMDFVPLGGEKKYKDKLNEVIAYEIGKNTSHTNEHLAFYFPKAKILWTGDLLFFKSDGSIYPAGARGNSIYNLITEKKLAVDKIYTSWPLHGQKEFGTVDFLKKLVTP